MVDIAVNKDKDGEFTAFICNGHAGFARCGKDIVCSAVSLLVINTINSLDEITHESMEVSGDEEKGLGARLAAQRRGTGKKSSYWGNNK